MPGQERLRHSRRDRLKQLRAFCYAARLKSISRAAERIASTQPAVSQQVRALEEDLAVALFERSGRRIYLTPAGERFYRLATPLVEALDRLRFTFAERYHGIPSSGLDIATGAVAAACVLPGYLGQFRKRHPDIRVNVKVADGSRRLRWLRDYEVDIVLAAVELPPPDLEFRPLFASELVLITPEEHPLAGRESVAIAEAAAYPTVTHPLAHYVSQASDTVMWRNGQTANPVLQVDGWDAIKHYVEAGVGISVVPEICLTERDRVWRIPATGFLPSRRYGVLTRKGDLPSLAAEWFIRTIDEIPPRAP